jgi:D-3-phosphoglycerate dehydrogenase
MVPHLGASTFEANFMAAKRSAEELIELETKGVTSYVVNRDIPAGLSEEYCVLANTLAKLSRRFIGRDSTPVLLETSFYGELEKYGDWMLLPIMAGMWEGFDSATDSKAARAYLEEVGVEYVNRKIDQSKGYGNSITLDLVGQVRTGTLKRISIRGTVAERTMVVSRINDFNKLYIEPVGHTLVFQYDDRPGVVGTIGVKLAEAGINILDVRHAHDVKSNSSLVIIGANSMPGDSVIEAIGKEIKAYVAFGVTL